MRQTATAAQVPQFRDQLTWLNTDRKLLAHPNEDMLAAFRGIRELGFAA